MEPSITRQCGPQFRARCRRQQSPPTNPVVTKALRLRWHHATGCRGADMSKWEVEKAERNRRSIARLTKSLPGIFPSAVLSRALGRPLCRRRRGSPSTRIGTSIHFVPIAWRVHLLAAVEPLAAGHGGSGIAGTVACQPHSERHQRPIGNAHTRKVQDFVVYAGNRFIASNGMPTYGTPAQTRMRPGTAPVWSHGNSGPHQVTTLGS